MWSPAGVDVKLGVKVGDKATVGGNGIWKEKFARWSAGHNPVLGQAEVGISVSVCCYVLLTTALSPCPCA